MLVPAGGEGVLGGIGGGGEGLVGGDVGLGGVVAGEKKELERFSLRSKIYIYVKKKIFFFSFIFRSANESLCCVVTQRCLKPPHKHGPN